MNDLTVHIQGFMGIAYNISGYTVKAFKIVIASCFKQTGNHPTYEEVVKLFEELTVIPTFSCTYFQDHVLISCTHFTITYFPQILNQNLG